MVRVRADQNDAMILLYTDFGYDGPYVGQMKSVLHRLAPDVPIIDVMHDAPVWNPRAAAYLLAALARASEAGDVWLCVVDPGVGGPRLPVVLECGDVSFVGPDNGLFEPLHRRIPDARLMRVDWRPDHLSATFHGRDLFAPVAAMIARGEAVPGDPLEMSETRPGIEWPDDLAEVIYVDAYGNLMTGIAGSTLDDGRKLRVGSETLAYARTFSGVQEGVLFWHRNSSGLVEIAANQARAVDLLNVKPGAVVEFI
ncbi:MAG: SAM-dependent chlorinase/fluorinase [Pseudomonadota bacterium]|nr:SAM-dependent chlorinase/fluorinase [Pseudomonadota bacterium]